MYQTSSAASLQSFRVAVEGSKAVGSLRWSCAQVDRQRPTPQRELKPAIEEPRGELERAFEKAADTFLKRPVLQFESRVCTLFLVRPILT